MAAVGYQRYVWCTIAVYALVSFDPWVNRFAPTTYLAAVALAYLCLRTNGKAVIITYAVGMVLLISGVLTQRGPFVVYAHPPLALGIFLIATGGMALATRRLHHHWQTLLNAALLGERKTRRLINDLQTGAVQVDGEQLHFNPALEKLIGWKNGELPTREQFFIHVFGPRASSYTDLYLNDRALGFPQRRTLEAMHRSGRTIFVEITAHRGANGDSDRDYGGEVWVVHDVSERVVAEHTVIQLQDRLLDAIETLDAGFVMYDADERLVVCNSTYRQLYFRSAPAMVPGARYEDILRTGVDNDSHLAANLSGEEWIEHHLARLRRKSGSEEQRIEERWIRIDDRPTRDGGVVSLRTDITALKHIEADLRTAKAEADRGRAAAEAGIQAKSNFLATMSHEIRTPLNGVIGMAHLLKRSTLNLQQGEHAATLLLCADNLLTLINGILDFTKIEAGAMDLEHVRVDPRRMIDDVVRMLATRAHDKNLELTWTATDDVPRRMLGDPMRLQQILVNLIGNAVKFTEKGSVSVRLGCTADTLGITINDTGIGISPETIAHLFSPFMQADSSTSRRYGGTGLGLAISRRLIELMGGTIQIASTPGAGSSFTLLLPIDSASSDRHAVVTSEPPPFFTGLALVVDDDTTNQLVARHLVGAYGVTVEVLNSGEEALVRLAHAPYPDLIFMDCQMPGLDGYETVRRLRAAECRLPIIAMTANALPGDRERCLAAGMDDYLAKPFAAESLVAILARWMKC